MTVQRPDPGPRLIDAATLAAALPISAAVDALERGFRDQEAAAAPLRSVVETPAGTLLTMSAAGEGGVGVKLVTLTPANPKRGLPFLHASYVLFDPQTQAPEAVIDGAAMTALRTAAVSGLATRHLARPDAHRLVLFGAGVQAAAHLEAMRAVRPIDEVVVVSRSPGRAEALAAAARTAGLDARTGTPDAVTGADLVCTCTTSPTPLFDGARLARGTHVNAVGAYTPDTREVDTETVRRARVAVEAREVALAEAGDLLIPIAEGVVTGAHILADLWEVVRDDRPVRGSIDDVTLFESVGMAFEDLIVARAVVEALG
jgi:ornithine cyclodeaminase/alanine dehydrogenase-like protein (mu-crystallin family)